MSYKIKVLLSLFISLISIEDSKGIGGKDFLSESIFQQNDTLPFHPDSVYNFISRTPERLLNGSNINFELTEEEWEADYDTLANVLKRRMPYQEEALGNIDKRIDSLKALLPYQDRDQKLMSIYHILNLPNPGTGHTAGWPYQRILNWKYLLFHPYKFSDGVYIVHAADSSLVGCQLIKINDTHIDNVYKTLSAYASGDNPEKAERRVEQFRLRYANALKAVGIINSIDEVSLTVKNQNGDIKKVTLNPVSVNSPEFVKFLTSIPSAPNDLLWSPASDYLRNEDEVYRLDYRETEKLLHIKFNNVLNASEDYTVKDFADSIAYYADNYELDKVVLDLRTNNGGNHGLLEPLTNLLINHPNINEYGKFYTLISWRTYSAAGTFALELERKSKTNFVGESSSFMPNHWGSRSVFILPNSQFTAKISPAYFPMDLPESGRTSLEPDIKVPFSSNQHFNNIDSAMIIVSEHRPTPLSFNKYTISDENRLLGEYILSPFHLATIYKEKDWLKLKMEGFAVSFDLETKEPPLYFKTDLYQHSDTVLLTDISDVTIHINDSSEIKLNWKGKAYHLKPISDNYKTPIEYFKEGKIDEGAEELRKLQNSGFKIGTNVTGEFFTNAVNILLEQDRINEALKYAQLAAQFWPHHWYSYAQLAEVHRILKNESKMLEALLRVKKLDPIHYVEMLSDFDI